MIIISDANEGLNAGLNKSKFLKKITLKGAIKGIKNYAPIALSLIPVAGGAVGKISDKILNSKVGKIATKVSKSKVGTAVIKLSKTDIAKNAIANVKSNLGSEALPANYTDHSEPAGEVMAVKPVDPAVAPAKNNTMLYLGGAGVVATIAFFAMKKK